MGLNHVRNSFVGGSLGTGVSVRGISGGEKRRVSIGCALLKNPAVVVLEQASGRRVGQNENPADFVLDCLVGLEHEEIVDLMSRIPKNLGPQVTAQDDLRPPRQAPISNDATELTA